VKLTAVAASAIISAVAVAGCSGDDDKGEGKPLESDVTTTRIISPPDLTEPPKLKKARGIIADTTMDDCSTEPGDVEASGVVTNSAKKPRDIAVVVSWTSGSGGDVVGRGVATFTKVPPGAEQKWSLTTVAAGEGVLQCVLSAQAGVLK